MTAYEDTVTGSATVTPSLTQEVLTLVDSVTGSASATPATPATVATLSILAATATCTPSVTQEALVLIDVVTGSASCAPVVPHTYIFVDLDNFAIENIRVSKNIEDALWRFSASVDRHNVPVYWKNLIINMVGLDRDDPPNEKNYLRFLGFIPSASYVFEAAAEKSNISGYDLGWYLAAQCIPSDLTVTAVDTNPADTLKSILGGADSLKTTGLDLVSGTITTLSGWDSIKKVFQWKFDTKKRKAVDELVDYCNYIFLIKFKQVGGGNYPIVYFVPYTNIDTGLDLPAIATFTNPDPYIIDIRQEIDESEKINRVVVHGTNRETGLWKTATQEAAEVTAGDVLPRELVVPDYTPEPPPVDAAALQTAVDNKASELYTLFYTNAATTTIRVQLRRRADLELWQKVGFVNYESISAYSAPDTNVFRIIDIQYSRDVGKDTVEIECVPDKDLSTLLARRQVLGMDVVSSEQAIMEDMLQGLPENQIGTVTAISGNVATVQLESSGKTVEARILNP